MKYTIRYKLNWFGPCEEFGDTKEETVIFSDGTVQRRRFDHHGINGHFRLVERAVGSISANTVKELHKELMNIVYNHDQVVSIDDADLEIIIEEPGLRISVDGGLLSNRISARELVETVLQNVHFDWKKV